MVVIRRGFAPYWVLFELNTVVHVVGEQRDRGADCSSLIVFAAACTWRCATSCCSSHVYPCSRIEFAFTFKTQKSSMLQAFKLPKRASTVEKTKNDIAEVLEYYHVFSRSFYNQQLGDLPALVR